MSKSSRWIFFSLFIFTPHHLHFRENADSMYFRRCCFYDTEEGANSTCKLGALSHMAVFRETEKFHSRRRADITSGANKSLIFCRLTVTLDLLAEELCICSEACSGLIFWTHVEWKFSAIFQSGLEGCYLHFGSSVKRSMSSAIWLMMTGMCPWQTSRVVDL